MTDFDIKQGASGAAGGAMAGSAFGPWGTAIGGGLGLLTGFLGGGEDPNKKYKDQLAKIAATMGNRPAPQAGASAQAGYSDARANQAGLIAQLEAMARGEGPSAAAIQMREAMDRAVASQTSAAATATGRGVNPGAAFLQASNMGAAITAQGARDTATLRAQEQTNALGQLAQVISQGRAQDENINQFNAGANNQMSIANLQAQLQTLGLNDEAQLRALLGIIGAAPPGPGLGTQMLAGGASALPSILQYRQGQAQLNANQAPGAAPWSPGPITSPSQV
jgi:hypothetical protein